FRVGHKKSAKVKLGENPKDPYGRKEEGQGKPNYFHHPACRWRARGGCLCFILGGKDRDLRLGLPGLSLAYPPTLILYNTIKKAVILRRSLSRAPRRQKMESRLD